MNPYMLLAILLFCLFGAVAVYMTIMDLFLRDKTKLDERMAEHFRNQTRERVKKTSLFRDLGKSVKEFTDDQESFIDGYQTMIDQSGLEDFTWQKAFALSGVAAVLGAALGYFLFGGIGAGILALVMGSLPTCVIKIKQSGRLNRLRSQLPDTFDLMARIIRAGQTMPQAMQAVSDEFPPPISLEFALCSEMMNLGIPPEDALQDLARRSGLIELKIFVLGLLITRETGGNLAEMLDNLAHVVRERFRIAGQISTLTAEGRMQAIVLMSLPPGMLVLISFLNPDYVSVFWEKPVLILSVLVLELLGWVWIRKIINFDY